MYEQEIHSINYNLKLELILNDNETNSIISNSYVAADRKIVWYLAVSGPAAKIREKLK